eukprot:UN16766
MHLHLLLHGLVWDEILLVELFLGDGLAQPCYTDSPSRLRLIASGEDMKVGLFALPV